MSPYTSPLKCYNTGECAIKLEYHHHDSKNFCVYQNTRLQVQRQRQRKHYAEEIMSVD